MRATHFAFRADSTTDVWRSDQSTYTAVVSAGGATLRAHAPREGAPSGKANDAGSALRLKTVGIRRAHGPELAAKSPTASVAPEGSAVLAHGSVDERYQNEEHGAEQSYRFASEPAGTGDLEVRIQTAGLAYRETTAGGLHFGAPGAPGFRYGLATWVDASGRRTNVPVAWNGDAIRVTVSSATLRDSAYPAVLDPLISPEIELDSPIAGNAPGAQTSPVVAFDGTNYVVVFADSRGGGTGNDLFGVRVSKTGTVLDSVGFAIAATPGEQRIPNIACSTNAKCVVAYVDTDNSTTPPKATARTVVVDSAKPEVLSGTLGAVTTNGQSRVVSSLAFDGKEFVAGWPEPGDNGAFDVRVGRLNAGTGALMDAGGVGVATTADNEIGPRISCAGTDCLVAWTSASDTATVARAARISVASTPAVLDTGGITLGDGDSPSVAEHGGKHFAIWNSGGTLVGKRIDVTNGNVLDTNPIVLASPVLPRALTTYAVAGGSAGFVATWLTTPDIANYTTATDNYASVSVVNDATGAVAPAGGIAVPDADDIGPLLRADIASSGSNYFVAWANGNGTTDGDVEGVTVTPGSGAPSFGKTALLTSSSNGEASPSAAGDADGFLVAWVDRRRAAKAAAGSTEASATDVYGARVRTSDDAALDPKGILLSPGTGTHGEPSVGFDGKRYLVVFSGGADATTRDVLGVRVDPSTGEVADATPIAIGSSPEDDSQPAVCGIDGQFLVVWNHAGHVVGARVDGEKGTVVDANGLPISGTDGVQAAPAVACGSNGAVVAWEDDTSTGDVSARRVDPSTGELGPFVVPVSAENTIERRPTVTALGDVALVAWEDLRGPTARIYAARFDPKQDAMLDTGIVLSTAAGEQTRPSATYDGVAALVAFGSGSGGASDIQAVRVDATSAVLDSTPIAIATESSAESDPAVAAGPTGHMLVAYTRFVPDAPYGSDRIRAHTVFYARAVGATCASDDDCTNGNCEDGICCATACGDSDPNDCRACSRAAGAEADGTCGTVVDTTIVCRPAASVCDVAETCDGHATSCPADVGKDDCVVPPDAGTSPDGAAPGAGGSGSSVATDAAAPGKSDASSTGGGKGRHGDDGCGCRLGSSGDPQSETAAAGVLALLVLGIRRQRKR